MNRCRHDHCPKLIPTPRALEYSETSAEYSKTSAELLKKTPYYYTGEGTREDQREVGKTAKVQISGARETSEVV